MSSPARPLVDPVHIFNAMGVSVLTAKHQGDEIDRLNRELEAANARIRSLTLRMQAFGIAEKPQTDG